MTYLIGFFSDFVRAEINTLYDASAPSNSYRNDKDALETVVKELKIEKTWLHDLFSQVNTTLTAQVKLKVKSKGVR